MESDIIHLMTCNRIISAFHSFLNAAAENSVRPSEGMAEGGCGGNSAMPERIELSPRHLPEYLEGRTPKKNVLSFLEEIGRAQIRKARNIFLWCPPSPRGGGGASSFVGILRKMGSDFFKQTPPNLICRRSCLGASPLGIGFRQEIPGGFEFRQKNSRQKSAVPKQSLDCAKGARADERFLEIVGVSAMPLSI